MEAALMWVFFCFFVALPATAAWGTWLALKVLNDHKRTRRWEARFGPKEWSPLAVGAGLVLSGVVMVLVYGKQIAGK